MELVRIASAIVKIAFILALVGQLKSCTLELLGMSAHASSSGMISYSKFTQLLTSERSKKP